MRIYLNAWLVAASLAFAAHLAASAATNPPSPSDRLKDAAELTSLDSQGLKPWHMKLDVTLFDQEGKHPETAIIEVWSAKGKRKVVETFAGATVTDLNLDGKLLRTGSNDPNFLRLDSLLDHVVEPIPPEVLFPTTAATEQDTKIGHLKMDCILPQLVPPEIAALTSQPLSYCMDAGTDALRLTFTPGHIVLIRPRVGSFQSRQVAVEVRVLSGTTLREDAKITQLASYEPADNDFTPAPDMQPVSGPIEMKDSEALGQQLWTGNPIYPLEARQLHESGQVKFDALIGPDGHITSLQPEGNAIPMLQTAATDAVKPFIYRPFRISGVAVAFKTVITVNFNIHRF